MRHIPLLITTLSFSLIIYGQGTNLDTKLSLRDSTLLNEFWRNLRTSVSTRDKVKLEAICEFPFYCRPCTNDTTLKHNDHVTIKVTRKIFRESQYRFFFDSTIRNEVNKHESFDKYIFRAVSDENNKPDGFTFPYTIVAPSDKWEGLQGFIYLKIKGNRYKITGIDTVP